MENHIKCKCVLYHVSLQHVIVCDLAERILHVISGNGMLEVPGPFVNIPNTCCKNMQRKHLHHTRREMLWEEDRWSVAFNTERKLQRPATQPQCLSTFRCRCSKPAHVFELHSLIEIYDSVKSLLELDWTGDSFPPNQSVWVVCLSSLVFQLRNRVLSWAERF